jgi:prevent-host-death family protein
MGTSIPLRELRNHNAQIIERVKAGESFTVTRDGVPVADVIPHVTDDRPPMFRPAGDLPPWAPLDGGAAADWLAEIRGLDILLDQSARDPWERD